MTIPIERSRAVVNMREAAIALIPYFSRGTGDNVLVPKMLLEALVSSLRHYPGDFDLEESATKLPKIWGWNR